MLDPRDPLLQSERTQGFAADPVYVKGEVFASVGLPHNLKDWVLSHERKRLAPTVHDVRRNPKNPHARTDCGKSPLRDDDGTIAPIIVL